jgi:hypothetical protein
MNIGKQWSRTSFLPLAKIVIHFSFLIKISEKNMLLPAMSTPSPPEGRWRAKLEGNESGTPPNPEALEEKGLNHLTHFPNR